MGRWIPETEAMKCVICKQAETRPGKTTVTLERDGLTLVVKGVPAQVCPNCGEAYVDQSVTAHLIRTAEETALARAPIDIREYVPA
jgi:YgiT-type zinc finger domain-containing protein